MLRHRRRSPWGLLVVVSAWIAASGQADEVAAEQEEARSAVVIYGDRDNGFELSTLLIDAGLACKPAAYATVTADWTTDVDLVLVASCCPGGWQRDTSWSATLLDRMGKARVIGCGDTGASLLQTKNLLVGHPHGFHGGGAVSVNFSGDALQEPAVRVLQSPHQLLPEPSGGFDVQIQQEPGDVEHIGIYDGGAFPAGTTGVARYRNEPHHWLICQQGNYMLWGCGTLARDMTDDAKKLLANLAWHLAHAEPASLVFPDKIMIDESREAMLVGGARDESYHTLARTGVLTVRLSWDADTTMMLMTHGAIVRRVDGASPLEISFPVNDAMFGKEVQIEVGSFQLKEGEECPFELTLDWED